jgi:hypothetical protein
MQRSNKIELFFYEPNWAESPLKYSLRHNNTIQYKKTPTDLYPVNFN